MGAQSYESSASKPDKGRFGSWPCDNAIWPPGARKSRLNLAGIGESEKFVPLSRSCLED